MMVSLLVSLTGSVASIADLGALATSRYPALAYDCPPSLLLFVERLSSSLDTLEPRHRHKYIISFDAPPYRNNLIYTHFLASGSLRRSGSQLYRKLPCCPDGLFIVLLGEGCPVGLGSHDEWPSPRQGICLLNDRGRVRADDAADGHEETAIAERQLQSCRLAQLKEPHTRMLRRIPA